jgi:threonine dehydratase
MTEVLERPAEQLVPSDAMSVHNAIQRHLGRIDLDMEQRLGIEHTRLTEIDVSGAHRLFVLDETKQPTEAFKYNGMAYAVDTLLEERPETGSFYTWSAGNAAAAIQQAAANNGRKGVFFTPRGIPNPKRDKIEELGGTVVAEHDDPVTGLLAAEAAAKADPHGAFLHPYNNLYAIAGQGLVGRRLLEGLLEHDIQGPIEVLVQRGGGSLIGSMASVLRAANIANVHLSEVRPDRIDDDKLDKRYDGLAVETPGSYAAAILGDERFFDGTTVYISELHTGLAGLRMARSRPFSGRKFEPSGLAGVAAYEKLAGQNRKPKTFVAVLSGANVTQEAYDDFADAPRRVQQELLRSLGEPLRTTRSEAGHAANIPWIPHGSLSQRSTRVLSGPTADLHR